MLPSTNSSYVSLASLSLSMFRNILSTRWDGEEVRVAMDHARGHGSHLLGRVFVHGELNHLTGHLVYGLDDLEHLLIRDEAVSVDVVQLESP